MCTDPSERGEETSLLRAFAIC